MAYKFQLGPAVLSGSIKAEEGIVATDVDDATAANIVAQIDAGEIPIAKLAASTVSGKALGTNLDSLTVANNSGLTMSAYNGSAAVSDLAVEIKANTGIVKDNDGIQIDLANNKALEFDSGKLAVKMKASSGLAIDADGIQADLANNKALEFDGGKLAVKMKASSGLAIDADGIQADLASNKALEFDGGKLAVKMKASSGLAIDADGIQVDLASNKGLEFDGGKLAMDIKANSGLAFTGNELGVSLDGSGGLEFNGGAIRLEAAVAGAGLSHNAGVLNVEVSGAIKVAADKIGITGSFATIDGGLGFSGGPDSISGLKLKASNLGSMAHNDLSFQDEFFISDKGTETAKKTDLGNLGVYMSGDGLSSNNGVQSVDLANNKALEITGAKLAVKMKANTGLAMDADGIQVDLANNKGLEFDGGKLAMDIKANSGLAFTGNELGVALASNKGLEFDSGAIAMDIKANSGLAFTGNELGVGLDADALQFTGGAIDLKDTIAGNRTFSNDVIINGDLTVAGATVTMNVATLEVEDALIRVAKDVGNLAGAVTAGAGFEIGNDLASFKLNTDLDGAGLDGFASSIAIKAPRFIGDVEGLVVEKIQVHTANGNVDPVKSIVVATRQSSDITLTLPLASGQAGKIFKFKAKGTAAGNVIIDGKNAETIDGSATITLESENAAVSLICDGTEWYVM